MTLQARPYYRMEIEMRKPSSEIVFLRLTDYTVEVGDPVHDIRTHFGTFTWRRASQEQPHYNHGQSVVSIGEDKQWQIEDILPANIVRVTHDTMSLSEATEIAHKLAVQVRRSIATGRGWRYDHSTEHAKLVAKKKAIEETPQPEPLAPWEIELLNSGSASAVQ